MIQPGFHIEINCQQNNHFGERICGDVFLSERIRQENRTILVLSDGMGHGVKANILATLTATMALSLTREHKSPQRIAETIMKTLPVCSERKISYATFTIVDIIHDQQVQILEYDNPGSVIIRNNRVFQPEWNCLILNNDNRTGKEILTCSFIPRKEDRIVFCTDGVVQAGMGSPRYPFGWGQDNLIREIERLIHQHPGLSAQELSARLVNLSAQHDAYEPKDDTSCVSVYLRDPRKLIISSGPPFNESQDPQLAERINSFDGKKIICGATTADIIGRELKRPIEDSLEFHDKELPPHSYMDGVDLITEGILTLGKVSRLLEKMTDQTRLGRGPADEIIRLILESDEIHFLIGTRINTAHQDPSLPVELEIRRTVIKRIASLLQKKFFKEVAIEYI